MEHYDIVVIGSGSGNTILDEDFADRRAAIIDSGAFGGTCLNVGCIPTKMFVLPADFASSPSEAVRVGVDLQFRGASFASIRDRIFGRIDSISKAGLSYRQGLDNIDVYTGEAAFIDAHTLEVGGRCITADQIVLAAGSRPRVPDVPGLDDSSMAGLIHTSDTIMRLAELPQRLVILGGGLIAAEFAHIFSGLGSQVTVINRSGRMLRHEDREISQRFTEQMGRRVRLRMVEGLVGVDRDPGGHLVVLTVDSDGVDYDYPADVVLNATGRVSNGDRLNLPAAGVDVDDDGFVVVDKHQRTNVEHIWALGDVCSPWELKHVANHEARVVRHNLLHPDDLAVLIIASCRTRCFRIRRWRRLVPRSRDCCNPTLLTRRTFRSTRTSPMGGPWRTRGTASSCWEIRRRGLCWGRTSLGAKRPPSFRPVFRG